MTCLHSNTKSPFLDKYCCWQNGWLKIWTKKRRKRKEEKEKEKEKKWEENSSFSQCLSFLSFSLFSLFSLLQSDDEDDSNNQYIMKILVVGQPAVGKTSCTYTHLSLSLSPLFSLSLLFFLSSLFPFLHFLLSLSLMVCVQSSASTWTVISPHIIRPHWASTSLSKPFSGVMTSPYACTSGISQVWERERREEKEEREGILFDHFRALKMDQLRFCWPIWNHIFLSLSLSLSLSLPSGQERFNAMSRVYYKEAVGAFVVFDVSQPATLEMAAKWKKEIDSNVFVGQEGIHAWRCTHRERERGRERWREEREREKEGRVVTELNFFHCFQEMRKGKSPSSCSRIRYPSLSLSLSLSLSQFSSSFSQVDMDEKFEETNKRVLDQFCLQNECLTWYTEG